MSRRGFTLTGVIIAVATIAVVLVLQSMSQAQGGPGLPVRIDGERYPGVDVTIDGELAVASNGCFQVAAKGERLFTIWPKGWAQDGGVLISPAGDRLSADAPIAVEGTRMSYQSLIQQYGGEDGYWGSVAGFCTEDDDDLLVVDQLTYAYVTSG